ncbi:MAG TPA: asparagine synthase-related protein [Woeseiaceae bacterium]|jgi:asparagine synthase (glutamine-hydrolysing)|nr:asparagine synthase-related protein [Woeseiaceae bacterium]
MSAIFGVVGAVSQTELEAMAERLTHRGRVAACEEIAPGVHLGIADVERRAVCLRNEMAGVVDLPPSSERGRSEPRIVDALTGGRISPLEHCPHGFAAAVWDCRSKSLLLARDFVGQKPLHWCPLPGGGIGFATEYKALLAVERLTAEADLDAIQYLQAYKATPPGSTLLKHVFTVAPGAVIRLSRDGRLLAHEEMRALQVAVRPRTESEVRHELASRYLDAIRPLVANAERVAVSLSGGIDSLSIAFATRRCAPQAELVGYTAGHGPDDPEIRTAARAIDRLGGRHEPVIVTANLLYERLPEAVWYLESPVGRTETIQMLEIARAAKGSGFDWLLSGIGSDALFAGMPKHKLLWLSQTLPPLRRDLHEFYALTQSGLKPQRPVAKLMDLIYFRGAMPPVPRINGAAWASELPKLPQASPEFLNHAMAENVNETLSRSLVRLERPLQACGIDLVSPFFDRSLMEYAYSIPSRLKIRRGIEKYILRQAMRSIVSPELLNVPKGIARIRQDRLFADTLEKLAARYVGDGELERRAWFRKDEVVGIRRRLRGRKYHPEAAMRLWTVIVSEIWARIYLDHRGLRP